MSISSISSSVVATLLAATVATLVLAALQRWKWAGAKLATRPLRTAECDLTPVERRAIVAGLLEVDEPESGAEVVEHISQWLASQPGGSGLQRSRATAIHEGLSALLAPGAHGVVTTLLFRERLDTTRERARSALASLHPFLHLEPEQVVDQPGDRPEPMEFARWATTTIGAPVLADSLDARGLVAGRLRTWNTGVYRGPSTTTAVRYEQAHSPGATTHECAHWQRHARAGDYDGRVLTVTGCSTMRDRQAGELVLLLDLEASCYAATEAGDQPWGCKKLDPTTNPAIGLRFNGEHALTRDSDSTRRPILTGFVALITSDHQLVLCDRSTRTSNGSNVISATAGGVSENGPTAEHSDRDELGWPDPTRTATRELKEELGVSIDPRDLRPACVFLSNSVNASSGKGQLGVCALLLARTELTYDELASRLDWASDLAQGRFEVQSLVRIPMGEHITDFAESIVEIAPRLDQHGALCIVYAARLYWEQHEVIGAFTEVFRHLDIERLAPPDVFAPQRF